MLSSVWLGFSEKTDVLSIIGMDENGNGRTINDMNPVYVIAGTQSGNYLVATGPTLAAAQARPVII